jgi:hypothetical protein
MSATIAGWCSDGAVGFMSATIAGLCSDGAVGFMLATIAGLRSDGDHILIFASVQLTQLVRKSYRDGYALVDARRIEGEQ